MKKHIFVTILAVLSTVLVLPVTTAAHAQQKQPTVDPKDPDAVLSCNDEICKKKLLLAPEAAAHNVTSLLIWPHKKC